MRAKFIQVKTMKEAAAVCPWAAVIVQAVGGFMAFESIDDFRTWEAQQ